MNIRFNIDIKDPFNVYLQVIKTEKVEKGQNQKIEYTNRYAINDECRQPSSDRRQDNVIP